MLYVSYRPIFRSFIDQKIAQFRAEIGNRTLSEEQQRIYNVFTRTKGVSRFTMTDGYGDSVRFKVDPSKFSDGPQHILTKHYRGHEGRITATEIINMCEVIRKGTKRKTPTHITYKLAKNVGGNKLILALKITRNDLVLKSFYSNRRK